jgi:hypothetical protein
MRKEVVVTCFRILSWHLCEQTEDVHGKISVRIVSLLARIHEAPPKYKPETLLLEPFYFILRW